MITPQDCERAKILGQWDYYILSTKPDRFTKGERSELVLDPLQCTVIYTYLKNQTLRNLPLKLFDLSGPTYRNEDKDTLVPLIKQLEFKRMEFIYFNYPANIVNIREKVLTQLEEVCLGLN